MSMFKAAKKKAVKPAAKKKASTKEEVYIDQLKDLAAVDAAVKSLSAMQTTLSGEVKEQMVAHFVKEGMRTKSKPASFRGIDDDASASCEIKKKSTRSKLSADEVELLEKHGIPYDTETDVPNLYTINAKYKDDDDLLEKVSAALEGIVPDDFIQFQEGTPYQITNAKTIDKTLELDLPEDDMTMLLQTVATFSVKPKYEGDVEDAMEYAKTLLD